MTTSKDTFLERVRKALSERSHGAGRVPLPDRGTIGYQGAGNDPLQCFGDQLTVAGGRFHRVPDRESAARQVLALVHEKGARRVLLGRGPLIDALGLPDRLGALGLDITLMGALPAEKEREAQFAADLGVSEAETLIAETGSVVLRSQPGEPRLLSLLPPVHVVVAEDSQIVPDLFDLFVQWNKAESERPLPSSLALITGPSKTGDIEMRLVTGVHGPGVLHVVVVAR
jgi:L-lactate dehydrogenase complex protein LldG